MNDHYFTKQPRAEHDVREVNETILGMEFTFRTDAGVFSKDGIDRGTRELIEAMPPLAGRALDLGCGWGAAGIPLARKNPGCEFLLTDINERAAALAEENARINGANNVRVVSGDGFEQVSGAFDAIFTNPPIRAGKQLIYALFSQARAHLAPGGALYIVIRKQQGAPSALAFLRETFERAEPIAKKGGYWVICATAPGASAVGGAHTPPSQTYHNTLDSGSE